MESRFRHRRRLRFWRIRNEAWESRKVGKWEGGKVGRWEGGKVGKWESGKVGKWESGKVGRCRFVWRHLPAFRYAKTKKLIPAFRETGVSAKPECVNFGYFVLLCDPISSGEEIDMLVFFFENLGRGPVEPFIDQGRIELTEVG